MYVPPEFFDNAREISPGEWNIFAWHPCAGEIFLNEFTQFPTAVKDGVLHHHERFNGHGYPFQVSGEHLGGIHTLLGTADTVAAILMQGEHSIADRVSVALRILPGEFPSPVVRFVTDMLSVLPNPPSGHEIGTIADYIQPELERLNAAKQEASKLLRSNHTPCVAHAVGQVLELLLCIGQSLGAKKIHGLLQRDASRNDFAIEGLIIVIPAEMSWRLRYLARNVCLLAGQSGNSEDLQALTHLISSLTPFRPR